MSWDDAADSLCPIARALAVVGDRWTLLILRELSFGVHRFDEMQAQTGMSSHLLASRLKRLEADGVIERHRYSERPVRYEYVVTDKGRDLGSMLLMLRNWGLKWGGFGARQKPALELRDRRSGDLVEAEWVDKATREPVAFDLVKGELSRAYREERSARAAALPPTGR